MLIHDILQSDGLMRHRLQVTDVPDRRPWLAQLCKERTVLHVGCCDVPVFDPNSNLHIELAQITERVDGLDISEPGIAELKRHVYSDYFTGSEGVNKEYQLVLAPEVLEHTPNPHSFLSGIFSVKAERYVITAPDIQWYAQTRREGGTFVEEVHGDHRAWYSPYTLLNAVRPFINEDEDQLELFLIQKLGSVGIEITKKRRVTPWMRAAPSVDSGKNTALERAKRLTDAGQSAEALYVLKGARKNSRATDLFYLEAQVLLSLGRHMDTFRSAVHFMKENPRDARCMIFAAEAAEGMGQFDQGNQLRGMAAQVA